MGERETYPKNPTFECIAASHRREALHALLKWGSPLTTNQLATYLTATDLETTSFDDSETEPVKTELEHVSLPALERTDLVDWNRNEGSVKTTTHPALGDPRFAQLLELRVEGLDDVLAALAHEFRRVCLTVLEAETESLSLTDQVREIRRRTPGTTGPDAREVTSIRSSLHHVHLPRLDGAGLVEYDPETGHATYSGSPALEEVFAVIYERDGPPEKLSGFFDGLTDSYRRARPEASTELEWPHFWRTPHNG